MNSPDLESFREKALAAGFADLGACTVQPFDEWRQKADASVRSFIDDDPGRIMAGARSLLVAVRRYGIYSPWPAGTAEVANYYVESNAGYKAIRGLAAALTEEGCQALANPRLPAKPAAIRAGLGSQGLNTQFCHDQYGPLVSLHLILTDAPFAAKNEPWRFCSSCGSCAEACQTGAITADGFAPDRCLRQHMLHETRIPDGMRVAMGTRLLGCTNCQHACPLADQAGNTMPIEIPRDLLEACAIDKLLTLDRASIRTLVDYAGSNFIRPLRVRRQAAIAAGNSGNPDYIPLLLSLLNEPDAVLHDHAEWAIARLGG